MRVAWFSKTVPFNSNPVAYQKDQAKAVEDVKLIFRTAAQQYQREIASEKLLSTAPPVSSTSTQALGQSESSGSFLADFCDVPDVVPIPISTISPEVELEDELSRYWGFEGG